MCTSCLQIPPPQASLKSGSDQEDEWWDMGLSLFGGFPPNPIQGLIRRNPNSSSARNHPARPFFPPSPKRLQQQLMLIPDQRLWMQRSTLLVTVTGLSDLVPEDTQRIMLFTLLACVRPTCHTTAAIAAALSGSVGGGALCSPSLACLLLTAKCIMWEKL